MWRVAYFVVETQRRDARRYSIVERTHLPRSFSAISGLSVARLAQGFLKNVQGQLFAAYLDIGMAAISGQEQSWYQVDVVQVKRKVTLNHIISQQQSRQESETMIWERGTAATTAKRTAARKFDLQCLTSALLSALKQKPAQTVDELKDAVDRRLLARVPLTYVCVALCRLVNDGCVVLRDGRCSSVV
jgi:hypothetical protein